MNTHISSILGFDGYVYQIVLDTLLTLKSAGDLVILTRLAIDNRHIAKFGDSKRVRARKRLLRGSDSEEDRASESFLARSLRGLRLFDFSEGRTSEFEAEKIIDLIEEDKEESESSRVSSGVFDSKRVRACERLLRGSDSKEDHASESFLARSLRRLRLFDFSEDRTSEFEAEKIIDLIEEDKEESESSRVSSGVLDLLEKSENQLRVRRIMSYMQIPEWKKDSQNKIVGWLRKFKKVLEIDGIDDVIKQIKAVSTKLPDKDSEQVLDQLEKEEIVNWDQLTDHLKKK
uniref:Uncharacterized protein n=1 Tax=Parastrongyloides trichosuri TaxID=131310 RepID=A0A0N4ZJL6_PARTI